MTLYNLTYEFYVEVEAENEDEAFELGQEKLYDMSMSDWDSVESREVVK